MQIIPLQDYVVIQEAEDIVGKSTIILTDDLVEPKNQGKIIKLPQKTALNHSELNEGDLVIFKRHMFDNLNETLNDDAYKGLVLGKQEHVVAIIKT